MTEMGLVILGVTVGFVATMAVLAISETMICCRTMGK